jgi:hypothetical protein
MDATNTQPDFSLYIGLLLGLSVKIIWIWKIEYLFINTSIQTTSELNIAAKNLAIQMKKQMNICTLLLWIVKYIRRKESPSDDPDHFISPISFK